MHLHPYTISNSHRYQILYAVLAKCRTYTRACCAVALAHPIAIQRNRATQSATFLRVARYSLAVHRDAEVDGSATTAFHPDPVAVLTQAPSANDPYEWDQKYSRKCRFFFEHS